MSNFHADLARAQKTQERLAEKLAECLNDSKILDIDGDKHYDIKILYGDKEITFESKEDLMSAKTGNMFLEYECSGKPSGITTTKSDFYLLTMAERGGIMSDYIIPVKTLRCMIHKKKYFSIVSGGDNMAARGYLFKVKDIICEKNCAKLEKST